MNRVRVLFFAAIRDRAGTKFVEIDIPDGATVRDLKEIITRQYPVLGSYMKTVLTSVNHEYASEDFVLPASAEVAIFPPVSGG